MNSKLWQIVLSAYPERPTLNPAEWPYSRERLEEIVDGYMTFAASLTAFGQAMNRMAESFNELGIAANKPVPPPPWAGNIATQKRPRKG